MKTAAPELDAPAQAAMLRALHRRLAARGPVQWIETHVSYLLVGAERAWKFKKAIAPGFLDYTTLARRRHCCAEELRLNRRLAPALYLGLAEVTGSVEAPELDGAGPVLDCAVTMRAFDQDGLWDRLAARGELDAARIDELVQQVARLHAAAAVAPAAGMLGTPAAVRAPMLDNLRTLAPLVAAADAPPLQRLDAWEGQAWTALEPVFAQRLREGRVRECHGDLHLGNVTLFEGRTTVFDGIEFNDEFRWIDVASEIAFMAMDLRSHGLPALASRFVDGCLQASGDYGAAAVLRYYLVHRALVRAKVAALRARQAGADRAAEAAAAHRYLALALGFSEAPPPALFITHGFSGSGKTTATQSLLEATGAIRIRADVERKRLAGIAALARSGSSLEGGIYAAAMTAATYARLCELARPVLAGGFSAVLDATFLQRDARDAARALA
ncbi:MAG: AAA family ATPase, partial [Burkholderiales bacterium]|nr:AAA family ATPase [Burkholderiales bacterium]